MVFQNKDGTKEITGHFEKVEAALHGICGRNGSIIGP